MLNDPLYVYYHMTNHYRKIRDVKKIVDTSPPLGYKRPQYPQM